MRTSVRDPPFLSHKWAEKRKPNQSLSAELQEAISFADAKRGDFHAQMILNVLHRKEKHCKLDYLKVWICGH
jgi:hypothetical protein